MGRVAAVCISEKKGTQKQDVGRAEFVADWGIREDAHAGKWHRQVSLLSLDRVEEFRARGAQVGAGAFGENLLVAGFDFKTLPVGSRFRCGQVELEMTQVQLANILGTTPQELCRMLKGKRPGYKYRKQMLKILKINENDVA